MPVVDLDVQDQELLSLSDRGDTKRYGLAVLHTGKKGSAGTGNGRQKIVIRHLFPTTNNLIIKVVLP
jgi:hypothetical protein